MSFEMRSPHVFIFSISIMFDGSLEILNATKNDEGFYTCFAENDRGRANSSGYLTITGLSAIVYSSRVRSSTFLNIVNFIFSGGTFFK